MIHPALLAIAVLAAQQNVPAPPAPVPVLQIAVHVVKADGREGGQAGDSGSEPFSSYVSTSETLCGMAASSIEPVDRSGTGWKLSGEILRSTGDEFLVRISWARLWEHGRVLESGPGESKEVTMRPGEHLSLDSVNADAPAACGVAARLEAAMITRARWQLSSPGGGGRGGASVAVGAARSGAGVGSSGGGAMSGRGGGSGTVVSGPPVDVDLWLVHRKPDGAEESRRVTVHATPAGGPFGFPNVPVVTSGGTIVVGVSGDIKPVIVNGLPAGLMITIRRLVGVAGAQAGTSGSSFMSVALPGAGEVLAFEMPPVGGIDPLERHQFSVRLRLASLK